MIPFASARVTKNASRGESRPGKSLEQHTPASSIDFLPPPTGPQDSSPVLANPLDASPSLSYSPFDLACSVFEMNIGTDHRAIRSNPNLYPSRMGQQACNVFTDCVFWGRLLRTFPTCTYQPLKPCITMQCGSTSFKFWYVCLAPTFISKYPTLLWNSWYFMSIPPKSKLEYLKYL